MRTAPHRTIPHRATPHPTPPHIKHTALHSTKLLLLNSSSQTTPPQLLLPILPRLTCRERKASELLTSWLLVLHHDLQDEASGSFEKIYGRSSYLCS